MLLITAIRESQNLDRLIKSLTEDHGLDVYLMRMDKLVGHSKLSLYYEDDSTFHKTLITEDEKKIDLSNIKVCFMANYPFVAGDWIPYENHYDKLYALQEWNATLTAIFQTDTKALQINSMLKPYDLNSELEHVVLLQKCGINTVDMLLTNDSKEALDFYEKSKKSVLFKSVRTGYDTASTMQIADLGRLNKLELSPAIFQKGLVGTEVCVCLLGKNILVTETNALKPEAGCTESHIPEELSEKLFQLSDELKSPWLFCHFIKEQSTGTYYAYGLNTMPDLDVSIHNLGERFYKTLINYLVEEYNK